MEHQIARKALAYLDLKLLNLIPVKIGSLPICNTQLFFVVTTVIRWRPRFLAITSKGRCFERI